MRLNDQRNRLGHQRSTLNFRDEAPGLPRSRFIQRTMNSSNAAIVVYDRRTNKMFNHHSSLQELPDVGVVDYPSVKDSKTELAHQLYELAFGQSIDTELPDENKHAARTGHSMKYFNEINRLRSKLVASHQLGKPSHASQNTEGKRSSQAKQGFLRVGSSFVNAERGRGLTYSESPQRRSQENARFRHTMASMNENYQLGAHQYQQEPRGPEFRVLPQIRAHHSQDKAVQRPVIMRSKNHQQQQQPGRTGSHPGPGNQYEVRNGGDDDQPYQNPPGRKSNEPVIITTRAREPVANATAYPGEGLQGGIVQTRSSWQASAARTLDHTTGNFQIPMKYDRLRQDQFLNTKSTNRTSKVTSKLDGRQPAVSNTRSGKGNPMFGSQESTDQQTIKSKVSVGPSQMVRVRKFQVSRFTNNSTLEFPVQDVILPKGTEKAKKVHYEVGDGYAKTMKVSNQRAVVQKKRFNIMVSGPIDKHSKLKQKTAAAHDRKSKDGSKAAKGGLSARRTTFAADVQEEARDYSSGDGDTRTPLGGPFLTDLPEEAAGDGKKKRGGKGSVFTKSRHGPKKLDPRPLKDSAAEGQLQVLKRGNPQLHSLNSLHQITRKFSKEQIRILGSPSILEKNYRSPNFTQQLQLPAKEPTPVEMLLNTCVSLQSAASLGDDARSTKDLLPLGAESTKDQQNDFRLRIQVQPRPEDLKRGQFGHLCSQLGRNSSMALLSRRSEHQMSLGATDGGGNSVDDEQSYLSRKVVSFPAKPQPVVPSGHTIIDIDKVNRNIEQKIVDIYAHKTKDQSKVMFNIQNVTQTMHQKAMGLVREQLGLSSKHSGPYRSHNRSEKTVDSNNRGSEIVSRQRYRDQQRMGRRNVRHVRGSSAWSLSAHARNEEGRRAGLDTTAASRKAQDHASVTSISKSPDVMLVEHAKDVLQDSKMNVVKESKRIDHQSYVAYVSDKLLQIYEDMHDYNISLDDLNSKNGLVQTQIKKSKENEHGPEAQGDLLEAAQMNLRIFEEEADDTQSPRLTDRGGRGNAAKKTSSEIAIRQPESAASKDEKEEKDEKAEKAEAEAEIAVSSDEMTAEEAIAALQAYIPPPGPINHVKQNIALSSKINKIRDIQLFYRNFVKDANARDARRFKQEVDMMQRQCSLASLKKWAEFRERRGAVVDRYAFVKKKMLWVKYIASILKCHWLIKRQAQNFRQERQHRAMLRARRFAALRTTVLWRVRLRKHGAASLRDARLHQLRHSFVFLVNCIHGAEAAFQADRRADFKDFFENQAWWAMLQTVKNKTIYFQRQIRFIQRRIQEKLQTLESKVDIIRQHWENMLFKWYQKAIETKDVGMKNILKQVARANADIREFVLQNYIRQCKKRYAIAFLEWRLHFSRARRENATSTQQEDPDVIDILSGRQDYMREEYKSHLENLELSHKTIKVGAFETIKSLKAYGFGNPPQQHLVNDFNSIAWPDPFPTPIRVAAKHVEPKPGKDEMQKYQEEVKEYNTSLLNSTFMQEAFDVIPIVHLVRMRAADALRKQERQIKQRLASQVKSVFRTEDQVLELVKGEKGQKKKYAKQKTKISPTKPKSRSKGKQQKSSKSRSPRKDEKSKDSSFDGLTAGKDTESQLDHLLDADSLEGSLHEVKEESSVDLQSQDPVAYFGLYKYEKFISKEDRELLRLAISGAKSYNFTYTLNRYHEDCSPMCVYIPSNDVLFKLMRATIGVTSAEEIWIYNSGYSTFLQTGGSEDAGGRNLDLEGVDLTAA